MKHRTLPVKTRLIPVRAAYKTRHFLRVYPDRRHPEDYQDTEVKTRTTRPVMLVNLGADAWQFYNVLEISYEDNLVEPTLSEPRDFSLMYFNPDELEDDDE